MNTIWQRLEEWYSLKNQWKVEEAKKILMEIYTSYENEDFSKDDNLLQNYISCLLWLWEIYMIEKNLEESLVYYKKWDLLTKWKNFNVVFNLWVVYTNLNDKKNADKYLKLAQKMEPNNQNLINFLQIKSDSDSKSENNNETSKYDESFVKKIQNMINSIK